MLEEDAIEHGENGLLLGLGEAADALELALQLGGGPALAGLGAGDAEQDIGGHGEERGAPGHEGEVIQADGRIRRWASITEREGRYCRVVLLADGETVHNAFFDRGFLP